MSIRDSNAPSAADGGTPRRAIASYSSYAEAERAVDRLSDTGFPVERVASSAAGSSSSSRSPDG